MSESKDLAVQLKIEQLRTSLDSATKSLNEFTTLAEGSKELREWAQSEITRYALSITTSKLDKDELGNFFKKPYVILPGKHEGEYFLAIPKFINAQFGWLHKVTESYNIFLVNKYVGWLDKLPEALKNELKFPDPLDIYLDGDRLVGSDLQKAQTKYGQFVTRKEKDGSLLIDKSRHFELLVALIKDGILPFVPKEIPQEDRIERKCDFELRDYQKDPWKEFLKYSNVGVFIPPSTGKTFFGLYAATHVKGPWLVVVPSRLLVEQWIERIELYTDLKVGEEIDVMTYHAGIKKGKQYKGKIIDEVHHLPSNEFSKLAIIPTDYTIGLSATPQREDTREEYIFALTGRPCGLNWEYMKQMGIIASPPLHVWIVKNETERLKICGNLLGESKKTIIFADSIEMGKTYAKRFDIPHVYGDTKQRLDKIQENLATIVSRVGDEGVSLPDIERVIEISWLHGSRRQELQRFTRLLHGKGTKGEGHIIMTIPEYQTDHKRLFGIMDKGFKIVLHRDGIEDKEIEVKDGKPITRTPKPKAEPKKVEPTDFEKTHPILSLPGIQKKLGLCTGPERKAVNLMYQRQDKTFTGEDLCNLLGYTEMKNMNLSFSKLIDLKLIKKIGKKDYQALV